MNKPFKILFLLSLFAVNNFIYSQQIRFDHLSINDGLSQSFVSAIVQDHEGYLWFGTKDGLNCYDGYTFTVFNSDAFDSTTIAGNEITCLYEDQNGLIWIGTSNGEVDFYDKNEERFHHVNYRSDKSVDRPAIISSIVEDSKSNIWIGTKGDGLYKLTGGRNNAEKIDSPGKNIASLYIDSSKNLWIGTDEYLIEFSDSGQKFKQFKLETESEETEEEVTAICRADKNNLLLGIRNGIILFNVDSGQNKFYEHDRGTTTGIVKDRQGNIWLGSIIGLIKFDLDTKKFEPYVHDPLNPASLSFNYISSLYCDKTGILWIGTGGEGLDILDRRKNRFKTLSLKFDHESGNSEFSIRTIFKDDQNYVWFATNSLYRWNEETGEIKSYESPFRLNVYSIVQLENGDIWFGGTSGLFVIHPGNDQINFLQYDPADSTKLPQKDIFMVFKDREGDLWTLSNNYLCKMVDYKKEVFKRYLYTSNKKLEIYRTGVYEDKNRNFWLTTRDGLLRFNQDAGSFKRFTYEPSDPNSLNTNYLKSICPDPKQPDDFLWIGTSGGGLNKFDISRETFSHFTIKQGLPNNVVYGILPDKNGNLWLSTNKGLSRFNPERSTFKNYDVSDGLQSNEFNTGAYFKSKSGELFFGGIKGLNYFYPNEIKDSKIIPQIIITQCDIRNNQLSETANPLSVKFINDKTKSLVLPYYKNIISFRFASMDLSAPNKNKFEYKLDNFDKNWVSSGSNHSAAYTNLPPGDYIFRVKGTNSDGVWNETGASFGFTILPPWWRTWWAYSTYGVLFLTMLFLLRRYELNRLKLKNQLRVEKVESDSLRKLDQLKSQFFANISHEFRTPLTLILGQIGNVMSSKIDVTEKGKLQVANRNANRLLTLINQLLDLSKIEAGRMEMNAGQYNIVSFLKSLFYSFESIAEQKGIRLKFYSDLDRIPVLYDPDKMEKIFYNLISNALKFSTEGGKVEVNLRISEPYLEISVKDNGIGIPEERLQNIFNRFYQIDSSSTRQYEGSGIGLSLTKELIELHNGKIDVKSKLGEGTEFLIELLLGEFTPESETSEQVSKAKEFVQEDFITRDTQHEIQDNVESQDPDRKIILIVEDNEDIRHYIFEQIEHEYKVLEAANGDDGLSIATGQIPDLIITDVMMPGIDGYEFSRKIRDDEKTSHIPIIMLTAKAGLDDKIEGLGTGVDAYLTKPFSTKELQIRIKKLIDQRERLRKLFSKATIIRPSEVSEISADQRFLRKVLSIIEENYENEKFSTEDLASGVNMSLSQLNRKLNALVDQPAGKLIRSMRLQRAADLIKQNYGSISEICYKVGFNDQAYFSRMFKKQFLCSPTEYKNS